MNCLKGDKQMAITAAGIHLVRGLQFFPLTEQELKNESGRILEMTLKRIEISKPRAGLKLAVVDNK